MMNISCIKCFGYFVKNLLVFLGCLFFELDISSMPKYLTSF